ncbi:MAG: hypothetical protein Ta2D_11190 [Rickettsiales bacterium]|nr:MAG: hypothetical protein Ta2D_11190 [Rickettsiales bacterium]
MKKFKNFKNISQTDEYFDDVYLNNFILENESISVMKKEIEDLKKDISFFKHIFYISWVFIPIITGLLIYIFSITKDNLEKQIITTREILELKIEKKK